MSLFIVEQTTHLIVMWVALMLCFMGFVDEHEASFLEFMLCRQFVLIVWPLKLQFGTALTLLTSFLFIHLSSSTSLAKNPFLLCFESYQRLVADIFVTLHAVVQVALMPLLSTPLAPDNCRQIHIWLCPMKPNRGAVTMIGSNHLAVDEDHMLGSSCQQQQTGR